MVKKFLSLFSVSLFLFIADRLLKSWFIVHPSEVVGGDFIDGVSLQLAKNAGAAFGFNFNQTALIITTMILLLILVHLLIGAYIASRWFEVLAFSLVITGAVSNLLDRFYHGFVVDYIDVSWFTVFNIADTMITVGVGLLILLVFKIKDQAGQS